MKNQPTQKELEVLQLAIQGHSTSEIAQIVATSRHAVYNKLNNLYHKLNACNLPQLIHKAARQGMLSIVFIVLLVSLFVGASQVQRPPKIANPQADQNQLAKATSV